MIDGTLNHAAILSLSARQAAERVVACGYSGDAAQARFWRWTMEAYLARVSPRPEEHDPQSVLDEIRAAAKGGAA